MSCILIIVTVAAFSRHIGIRIAADNLSSQTQLYFVVVGFVLSIADI